MRRSAPLVAAVALALALPPAAQAHSGISIKGSLLIYSATDFGSISHLSVTAPAEGTIRLSDPPVFGGMSPGPCVPISEQEADCPAEGIALLAANVGEGEDTVTVGIALGANLSGGSGNDSLSGNVGADLLSGGSGDDSLSAGGGPDRVYGGYGSDVIDAGAGDDEIEASDGFPDSIACGPGADTLNADDLDAVTVFGADACESVTRGPPVGSDPGTEAPVPPTSPGSPPTSGAAEGAPVIASLRLSPARFRAAARGPALSATGTRVRYRLSEPAASSFSVEQARSGRRAGRRCRPPGLRARGRRCTRWVRVGGFAHAGREGLNSLRFRGRVKRSSLPPGRYRLTAVAVDAAGKSSAPRRVRFRVLGGDEKRPPRGAASVDSGRG